MGPAKPLLCVEDSGGEGRGPDPEKFPFRSRTEEPLSSVVDN